MFWSTSVGSNKNLYGLQSDIVLIKMYSVMQAKSARIRQLTELLLQPGILSFAFKERPKRPLSFTHQQGSAYPDFQNRYSAYVAPGILKKLGSYHLLYNSFTELRDFVAGLDNRFKLIEPPGLLICLQTSIILGGLTSANLFCKWRCRADLITASKIFMGLLGVDPKFFLPPTRRGLRVHP